jgi:hypothetical protein
VDDLAMSARHAVHFILAARLRARPDCPRDSSCFAQGAAEGV